MKPEQTPKRKEWLRWLALSSDPVEVTITGSGVPEILRVLKDPQEPRFIEQRPYRTGEVVPRVFTITQGKQVGVERYLMPATADTARRRATASMRRAMSAIRWDNPPDEVVEQAAAQLSKLLGVDIP